MNTNQHRLDDLQSGSIIKESSSLSMVTNKYKKNGTQRYVVDLDDGMTYKMDADKLVTRVEFSVRVNESIIGAEDFFL